MHNKVNGPVLVQKVAIISWLCRAEFDSYTLQNIHSLERVEAHSHTHTSQILRGILRFCHGKTMPDNFHSKSWTRQILHVSPYDTPNSPGSKWKPTVTNILLKRNDNITKIYTTWQLLPFITCQVMRVEVMRTKYTHYFFSIIHNL